jgi:Fic family protein
MAKIKKCLGHILRIEMDKRLFTSRKTGQLVEFEHPLRANRKDWAFIADCLPPQWTFSVDLWPLLSEAKTMLGKLDGIGETLPNPDLLLMPLQRREAISSSSIEGTHVTPDQLLLFELDPREGRGANDHQSDWEQVFAYREALLHGFRLLTVGSNPLPICHRVICEMHQRLMRGAYGAGLNPGEYRKLSVQIGSGDRFIPAPPGEVQRLMDDFERNANGSPADLDPLVMAFIMHYQFEAIHPFQDGNGRIGRALLALMIQLWLGHKMPWLYLSAYFERHQLEYYNALFRVSTDGAWKEWVEFCLRGTIEQAADSILRCRLIHVVKQDFANRLPPRSRGHLVIPLLLKSPVISIPWLKEKLDVAYTTAQGIMTQLVKAKIVEEQEGIYPRTFVARNIMAAAFDDLDVSAQLQHIIPSGETIANALPSGQSPTA